MVSEPRRPGARSAVAAWAGRGILVLCGLALGDWLLLKSGALAHPPWVLAALVSILSLFLAAFLIAVALDMARGRRRPGTGGGQLLLGAGLLTLMLGGLFNWLLSLQGFAILLEGDAVPLHGGSHLQAFDGGPLARLEEMHLTLLLKEVELRQDAAGRIEAESLLAVQRDVEEPVELAVSRRASVASGPLRFHQGAFGFAPRIVILRGRRTLFDRVVPFTTERRGQAGMSFEGLFRLEEEELEVEGAVDLASLDEGLRGHATLRVAVRRNGVLLGRGSLLPGHFAEIDEGYRIGFAGLEKWSEIDISRRTYDWVVLAGAGVALAGGVLWPLARWRRV